jgi:ABC-2 type transport system permease protein
VIGTLRAEWRKLALRPANWTVCGLLLAAVAVFAYGVAYLSYTHAALGFRSDTGLTAAQELTTLYPNVFVQQAASGFYPIGAALALLIGILSAGSEYGWQTLKLVFLNGPGRLRTLLARLTAISMLMLCEIGAFLGLAAIASLVVAGLQGHAVTWPAASTVVAGVGTGWLILTVFAFLGMALAFVFRQAPAAIGAGFAYLLVIEGLVVRLVTPFGGDTLKMVEKMLPGPNASALVQALGTSAPVTAPTPLVGAVQAVAVLLLYCTALGAIAAVLVHRRDLT